MMTPQEVLEKRFKPVMMGGYETSAVDAFMESVTDDYSALFKENAVLKGKLKVLADKVEEYRAVDAAMRQALLAAQKMASEMVSEAEKQRDEIITKARTEAEGMKSEFKVQSELEEKRLEAARRQTLSFVNGLRELYTREIEMLAAIPSLDIPDSKKVVRERRERSVSNDISKNIETSIQQNEPAASVNITRQPARVTKLADPAEDDEPEDITQRTISIPRIIREKYPAFNEDQSDEEFFKPDGEEDTVVPQPRSEPPADMDKFFGHRNNN